MELNPSPVPLPLPQPILFPKDWDLPIVVALLVLALLVTLGSWWFARSLLRSAREEARARLELARTEAGVEANRIRTEAALEIERRRNELTREEETRRGELEVLARDAATREAQLQEREKRIQGIEERLQQEYEAAVAERSALRAATRRVREQLETIGSLQAEQARSQLLESVRAECEEECRRLRRELLDQSEAEIELEARRRLVTAMQRLSSQPNEDLTATLVALPSEEMKGRIIGREGRNIRSFEAATGVTLLIDDSPQTVLVSSFDPVRREVARLALERLIQDGRIHPASIEEFVARAQRDVEENVLRAGEQAADRLNISGLALEVLSALGRLKYRFSFSQNVLDHSVEVGQLCALVAAEIGLDPAIARRAGLLHDIGKAMPAEQEGSHAQVGADLCRRFGESAIVCNAIAAHHEEVPPGSIYAGIVILADRVSAVRPGARAESMAAYAQRLERLEKLALGFPGVQHAYAISAGREIRVVVAPAEVDDQGAADLARALRRRIEDTLQYPSTIKVTVIREQRFVETAR